MSDECLYAFEIYWHLLRGYKLFLQIEDLIHVLSVNPGNRILVYQEHHTITEAFDVISATQSIFFEPAHGTKVRRSLESVLLKSLVDSIYQIVRDKSEVKDTNKFILNSEIVRLDILVDQTSGVDLLKCLQHLLTNILYRQLILRRSV